ncbi:3-dehydroquinate synthase [Geitlerinema sp. PCC 9228]|uniref:3-dehydroquinate synthase n=1 Tax=Geitlerinema sp. PCC 9228 TaxID=111611 RepID=UPI0008F9962D|nr:3-dehydroquinate synthase [Geitlerinema sp. PCC 9228]
MSTTISVSLPDNSYPIHIVPGMLDRLGSYLAELNPGKKVLLVSNQTIFPHYGDRAIASLQASGFDVATYQLPDGEAYKTLDSISQIYDAALDHRLERSSTMVALGGGVVGDMTGFAAATWLRGIHFVQVPTSLLAMVDASVGGKTGVNHPQGKNLIGAFYQPRLVAIDPDVLQTLPEREFRAGMAEVIKYGIIWDVELFLQLEKAQRLDSFVHLSHDLLEIILSRSVQSKADVVAKDEKEAGLRAILNYGHTIAHAIETLTHYQGVNHGEAVAIGMVAASRIAAKMGMWDPQSDRRQYAIIEKAGLPTQLPAGLNIDEIVATLQKDKKVQAGKVRFILPEKIGQATISDRVMPETVKEVLQDMLPA